MGQQWRLAKGEDWLYAGWYVQMLGIAECGDLPIAYADWYSVPLPERLPTTKGFESGLPMLPGGTGQFKYSNQEIERSL